MASPDSDTGNQNTRRALRAATIIVPRTGERIRRTVSLSITRDDARDDTTTEPQDDRPSDARTPLLGPSSRRSPSKSLNSRLHAAQESAAKQLRQWTAYWLSRKGQSIVKCALAYFLGSLFTFNPWLSGFLGHQDGKHVAATVTIYFHPARSRGSMFEAIVYALMAFVYSAGLSLASIGVIALFRDVFDQIAIGRMLVLFLLCGGGFGVIGWIKQRLSNPLVNVACSLASLGLVTVIVREEAVQAGVLNLEKVDQVLRMVIFGCVSSTLVCFFYTPVSARNDLKKSLVDVTNSLADSLSLTTRAFLSGSEEDLDSSRRTSSGQPFSKLFSSISSQLRESKWENYVYGQETEYRLEARLVQCIQRLSQNIGGLRSAARSQFDLLSQQAPNYDAMMYDSFKPGWSPISPESHPHMYNSISQDSYFSNLDSIVEDERDASDLTPTAQVMSERNDDLQALSSPKRIFDRFIDQLGPSIRSLVYTLHQILKELPYGPAPDFPITLHPRFRESLDAAIDLYSEARREALKSLYQRREMNASQPRALAADLEEVAASCGYFSYSLQDFAEELRNYLSIIAEMQIYSENDSPKSWNWLKFWKHSHPRMGQRSSSFDGDEPVFILASAESHHHDEPANLNLNTKHQPWAGSLLYQTRWHSRLLRLAQNLGREDIRFAVKVGLGAALYTLPAFIPRLRPFYTKWRGEWGLLSYMLVCTMTVGASNATLFARVWGTCVGAAAAVVAWYCSQESPWLLAFYGFVMQFINAYMTIEKAQGPLARFIMLTYNLTCLYAYSLSVKDSDDDDDEEEGDQEPKILGIAYHRVVAVAIGCAWGVIITRAIWPISARKKFNEGLGKLLLRMSLIWKRDPLNTLVEGSAPHPYMDLSEEFHLQQYYSQLQSLRMAAATEFELRGPFPSDEFGKVLDSVQRMLEALHAMNVVITKDLRVTPGEAEILRYTRNERDYLSTRISHLFQVLASSLRLQFPLNDTLPDTDNARDRLLAKIFSFRRDTAISKDVTDADFALLYAYSLVTMQLSREIKQVGTDLGNLYGILDEDRLKLR